MVIQSAGAGRPRVFPRILAFAIATVLMIGGFVNEQPPFLLIAFVGFWVFALAQLVKATQTIGAEGSMSIDGDAGGDGGGDGGGGE